MKLDHLFRVLMHLPVLNAIFLHKLNPLLHYSLLDGRKLFYRSCKYNGTFNLVYAVTMAIIGFASRENLRELNEKDMMNILLYA